MELKRLAEGMGLAGCLQPLIMDSCHIVLPKERREERVSVCCVVGVVGRASQHLGASDFRFVL